MSKTDPVLIRIVVYLLCKTNTLALFFLAVLWKDSCDASDNYLFLHLCNTLKDVKTIQNKPITNL